MFEALFQLPPAKRSVPLPVDLIVFFEKRGKIVDLVDGRVYNAIIATPTSSAQAVCHLLSQVEGEIVI